MEEACVLLGVGPVPGFVFRAMEDLRESQLFRRGRRPSGAPFECVGDPVGSASHMGTAAPR
ncbi:hypothetical protein SPHV1_2400040 [Novosphingobium sp. KN65.2]|nr:hypothetical protein SPHV1_2400040 [Novosphingobium sp. KN65.2]